jgi:replication factor A1
MKLNVLRPGMENIDLRVKVLRLDDPREVTTKSGIVHILVEGEVEDETGRIDLTVWNNLIEQLRGINAGDIVELCNCFVTSFRGVLSVNVGRDSRIVKLKRNPNG